MNKPTNNISIPDSVPTEAPSVAASEVMDMDVVFQNLRQLFAKLEGITAETRQERETFKKEFLAYFDTEFSSMRTTLADVKNDVERMDRRVKAIEIFPTPYGRPKAFHADVQTHSVSGTKFSRHSRF